MFVFISLTAHQEVYLEGLSLNVFLLIYLPLNKFLDKLAVIMVLMEKVDKIYRKALRSGQKR